MQNDLLLLINTLLGCFAGLVNGYYAWRINLINQRILQAGMALLSTSVGVMYGAALLGHISADALGPMYLRPTLSIILVALAASPFVYGRDYMLDLEQQLAIMRQKMVEQDEEIGRLNDLIKTLVKQFAGLAPVSVPVGNLRAVADAEVPLILVAAVESSHLKVRSEVDAIFDSGLRYEHLPPPVSRNRMISEMDRLRPQAVHLLGHMSATGMMMADGIATIGWWRRMIERYGVEFIFANGCESLDIVDSLHVDGVQCVIGMRGAVKDESALEFSRQFYAWLAAGRSASESVELAKLSLGNEDAEQVVIRGDWMYR